MKKIPARSVPFTTDDLRNRPVAHTMGSCVISTCVLVDDEVSIHDPSKGDGYILEHGKMASFSAVRIAMIELESVPATQCPPCHALTLWWFFRNFLTATGTLHRLMGVRRVGFGGHGERRHFIKGRQLHRAKAHEGSTEKSPTTG
jgi:hypothetical protein